MAKPGKAPILLVSADKALLDKLSPVLAKAGYKVEGLCAAHDVVQRCLKGDVGAVVTGMAAGGATGLEILAAVKRVKASIPVILVGADESALDEEDDDDDRSESGYFPEGILPQPVDTRRLISLLADCARS